MGKFPDGANFPERLNNEEQGGQIIGLHHERADIAKEHNRSKIAKKVKLKRTELGMTQCQLAEKAGITTPTIVKIESGDYNVSIDVLSTVMSVLGIKILIEDY